MKRDPQLIRQILLACEEHEHGYAPRKLDVQGYTDEQIGYHVYLLGDAGYMEVFPDNRISGSKSPRATPKCLTSAGHDFLDATRDEEVWKNTKNVIAKTGGWTLSVIASVATEIITRKAMAAIGS